MAKLDRCAGCKRVIPKQEPYLVATVRSGPQDGKRVPERGVMCEACLYSEMAKAEYRGCVSTVAVYH